MYIYTYIHTYSIECLRCLDKQPPYPSKDGFQSMNSNSFLNSTLEAPIQFRVGVCMYECMFSSLYVIYVYMIPNSTTYIHTYIHTYRCLKVQCKFYKIL